MFAGVSGATTLTVTAAVLESISVTPVNPMIPKGETQQFLARGTYSDNSTQDITAQVTWASQSTAVATITSSGLATGQGTGSSTISATQGSIVGSTLLTVSAAVLESIAVTPDNPEVAAGLTVQFTATGTYSDDSTQDLTTQAHWQSDTPAVATISNAAGSHGLATTSAMGMAMITAALGSVTGMTMLMVDAAQLESIAVAPANPSIIEGATEQFTATGSYSDHSTQDLTTKANWQSTNTSIATIASTGLATGVSPGSSVISAQVGGVSGTTVLNVSPIPLTPTAVIDNSQAGYYQYGVWSTASGGYKGNHATANPATSPGARARWLFTVPAGTYDVWATWVSATSDATNAPYSIYDGFTNLGSPTANQQVAPVDGQYGGVLWKKLGTFKITNGNLTVGVAAAGANGSIVADGVLVVPDNSGSNALFNSVLRNSPGASPGSHGLKSRGGGGPPDSGEHTSVVTVKRSRSSAEHHVSHTSKFAVASGARLARLRELRVDRLARERVPMSRANG
jgi:hypothetical protein